MSEDADALRAVGLIQKRLGNFEFAIEYLERAKRLNPEEDVDDETSLLLELLRRYEEAEEKYARIVESRPIRTCQLARIQVRQDLSTDRARQTIEGWDMSGFPIPYCWYTELFDRRFDYMIQLAEPISESFVRINYNLGWLYRFKGDTERERQSWQRLKDWPENGPLLLAFAEAGLGNREEALTALSEFANQLGTDEYDRINTRVAVAEVYLLLGMYEKALDELEADADGPGNVDAMWLRLPQFDPMRDHPRFEALVKRFE